ncbi:MAG: hypothetical protein ABI707_14990 [Ferruginibacter sp.]
MKKLSCFLFFFLGDNNDQLSLNHYAKEGVVKGLHWNDLHLR